MDIPSDSTPNLSSPFIASLVSSSSTCPNITVGVPGSEDTLAASSAMPKGSIDRRYPSSSSSSRSQFHSSSSSKPPNELGKKPDRLKGSSLSAREKVGDTAGPLKPFLCAFCCKYCWECDRGRLNVIRVAMGCGADLERLRDIMASSR